MPSTSKLIGLNPIFDEGLIKVVGKRKDENIPKKANTKLYCSKTTL